MMGRAARCMKCSICSPLNHAGVLGCFEMQLPGVEAQGFLQRPRALPLTPVQQGGLWTHH